MISSLRSRILTTSARRCFSSVKANSTLLPDGFTWKGNLSIPQIKEEIKKPLSTFLVDQISRPDRAHLEVFVDGNTGKSITFSELNSSIESIADSLLGLGLKKGDIVSIISPNHLFYASIFIGITRAGLVSTPINPQYSLEEVIHQISITKSNVIFTHSSSLEKILQLNNKDLKIIVIDKENVKDELKSRNLTYLEDIMTTDKNYKAKTNFNEIYKNHCPDTLLTLPFSSGTTGKSKGVMLSHSNIISNILQAAYPEGFKLINNAQTTDISQNIKDFPSSRIANPPTPHPLRGSTIVPLPFFHIFGLTAGILLTSFVGGKLIFLESFDFVKFLTLIQQHKVSRGLVVPPILLALAKHPIVDKFDLSSLRALTSGAAPLSAELQIEVSKRLNIITKQGWGMTESSPVGAIGDEYFHSLQDLAGNAGPIAGETYFRIQDVSTKEYLGVHQEGEILVGGPQIMLGYYNNDEATVGTLEIDPENKSSKSIYCSNVDPNEMKWLHTGDIGYISKTGHLHVTDRLKELIKYKGFQVPPAELEAHLISMPQIKDAVVIPVPHPEAGEVPRAYVVPQDGYTYKQNRDNDNEKIINEEIVNEFINSKVAHYKKLRGGIFFINEVPKSAAGKLLRRVMIEKDREMNKPINKEIDLTN